MFAFFETIPSVPLHFFAFNKIKKSQKINHKSIASSRPFFSSCCVRCSFSCSQDHKKSFAISFFDFFFFLMISLTTRSKLSSIKESHDDRKLKLKRRVNRGEFILSHFETSNFDSTLAACLLSIVKLASNQNNIKKNFFGLLFTAEMARNYVDCKIECI